eukprot:g7138.t1
MRIARRLMASLSKSSAATAVGEAVEKIPVVVVIGATGTGKTKLGVELAKKLNGEVVNADSLQMYRGLSVATAKPTKEEMDGVPHHLMSFLPPTETFTTHDFCKRAVPVIEDIHKRGKLPILVGGTLYYVQSLLWDSLLSTGSKGSIIGRIGIEGRDKGEANHNSSSGSSVDLYAKLQTIDPVMAQRLHPNNIRKIERSIEIFETTGKRHSDLIDLQKLKGGGLGGRSRYNYRMLWLHCEKETLERRLNKRIGNMLEDGLENEIRTLQRTILEKVRLDGQAREKSATDLDGENRSIDTYQVYANQGVLQAIGFKEFGKYLELCRGKTEADISALSSDESALYQAALKEGTEALSLKTRKYAKQQIKWIKNRMVKRGIQVHMLDTTNYKTNWTEVVSTPALYIAKSLYKNSPGTTNEVSLADEDVVHTERILNETLLAARNVFGNLIIEKSDPLLAWKKFRCEVCNMELDGQHEYEQHLRSKSHKRAVSLKKRVAGDRNSPGIPKRPKVAASNVEKAKDEPTHG